MELKMATYTVQKHAENAEIESAVVIESTEIPIISNNTGLNVGNADIHLFPLSCLLKTCKGIRSTYTRGSTSSLFCFKTLRTIP